MYDLIAVLVGLLLGGWSLVNARQSRRLQADYKALVQAQTELLENIDWWEKIKRSECLTLVGHVEGESVAELPQVGESTIRYVEYYRN